MENKIPQTFQMARYLHSRGFEDLKQGTVDQLKKHLLDALGSMIHCLHRPTIEKLARQIMELDGGGKCPVPVLGKIAIDRAAQYYTALIRYPDFMDNYLGKEATCHPSDNIGPLLAVACHQNVSGKDFLLCMALAYEMECRLIEEVPVMIKGFDHTLLLAYSVTGALCRMLGLNVDQTAHALSIAGCSFDPLVSCRASYTREWKGMMSSLVALGCTNIVYMAREGMTGPTQIFEGGKGFGKELGLELNYDWDEDQFDLITKCILKSYNAEVHTQSLIEAALELKHQHNIDASQIEKISLTTFLTAYHIVGGGEYGDRKTVYSKEQADHSLPYVIAAALLDGELYPEQLLEERINRSDVQTLLQKVEVHTGMPLHEPKKLAGVLDPFTRAYPEKVKAEVKISLSDGNTYSMGKDDYYGFYSRPMNWADVEQKFRRLAGDNASVELQDRIIEVVKGLEQNNVQDLAGLLCEAGKKDLVTADDQKAG